MGPTQRNREPRDVEPPADVVALHSIRDVTNHAAQPRGTLHDRLSPPRYSSRSRGDRPVERLQRDTGVRERHERLRVSHELMTLTAHIDKRLSPEAHQAGKIARPVEVSDGVCIVRVLARLRDAPRVDSHAPTGRRHLQLTNELVLGTRAITATGFISADGCPNVPEDAARLDMFQPSCHRQRFAPSHMGERVMRSFARLPLTGMGRCRLGLCRSGQLW